MKKLLLIGCILVSGCATAPNGQNFGNALRAMQQATANNNYQQQQQMNGVFAANPEFAACRYYGQCNTAPQPTHTVCRNVYGTLQCDSY